MNDATIHIATSGSSYKPVMTNHFIVTISGLDGMKDWTSPDADALITDSELTLKVANQSFKEPTLQQTTVGIKRGNLEITFPGSINPMSSDATFQVFVNRSAYNALYSWKMLSGNHETGDVGDPNEYWKTVTVDITSGNKGTIYSTWTLPNAWISSLQGASFSNDSNEVKAVSITLHYFQPTYRRYEG